jgi:hypothetical protein
LVEADDKAKPVRPSTPEPIEANVPYGKHPKQVVDFYKAESREPTPVVIYIHGGGWGAGSKGNIAGWSVDKYLEHGISVVSVEYRFIRHATRDGIEPPVMACEDGSDIRLFQLLKQRSSSDQRDVEVLIWLIFLR